MGSDGSLRRRMHVLERAHSDFSARSSHTMSEEQEPSLTEMDYETPSETSEDHSTATAPTSPPHAPPPRLDTPKSPSRAWYQFDFAVVVALVSPVGNLLTGGDLIKNLLYILFLLFYLHQIIEGACVGPYNDDHV